MHGLSTAYHLALEVNAHERGSGEDILVLDKSDVAAAVSDIACGVIRNNYFQPAMRELMAHSVEVWESNPVVYSYHPVGYMQISPEVMHADAASSRRWRSITRRSSLMARPGAPLHAGHLPGLASPGNHLGASQEEGEATA